MLSKEFCHLIAHTAASEFIRLAVEKPETEAAGVAILEVAGVQIVVSITKYEGPAQLHLTPAGAALLGLPEKPPIKLTELQRDALEAAPSRLHNPISMKELASISGYAYNTYFTKKIGELIDAGLLVKLTDGVRKAG